MEKVKIMDVDDIYDNFDDFTDGKKKAVIELPVVVADICKWYGRPTPYSALLGMSPKDMERIIYNAAYVVTNPGDTPLINGAILTVAERDKAKSEYGEDAFEAVSGARAVKALLEAVDTDSIYKECRKEERSIMARLEKAREEEDRDDETVKISDSPDCEQEETDTDRLRAHLEDVRVKIDACICMKKNYGGMFLDKVTLLPLALRGMVQEAIKGHPYGVNHDLTALYSRVYMRAERLRKLMELNAPEIIIRNEERILQEYVDSLLANGMRGKPVTKGNGYPLFCLRDVVENTAAAFL